ncbi:MAG: hypothetical protein WC947_08020 [Elusimicrobiota bacterium]
MMWVIKINSKQNLSDADRDFVAELVSEEARSVIKSYSFILHNIIESKRYCEVLVEGSKTAIVSLLSMLKNNIPYKINYEQV